MCLNQILFDEQIALIGYHAATDPADVRRHRQQLAAATRLVAPFPYPHRPYYPWTGDGASVRHAVRRLPLLQAGHR